MTDAPKPVKKYRKTASREVGRIIKDKDIFGWVTLVPAGPAHRDFMETLRENIRQDLEARKTA